MSDAPAITVAGQVRTTSLVNVRQGEPSTSAPVLRRLAGGTSLTVQAIVAGDAVQGNPHWYQIAANQFVWAGACSPFIAGAATAPTAAVPAPVSSVVRVVDMSHLDGVTSFSFAQSNGLWAVIHKATTGATGRDDQYAARRTQAEAAGLLWGAYHWGTDAPVPDQLDNFFGWANPGPKTLIALDYETSAGSQMTLPMARAFLQGVINKIGRKAALYSGELIKTNLGSTVDPFLGSHKLWLCEYGPKPKPQASWESAWLWQYTDGISGPFARSVPGIVGNSAGQLDCDEFDGNQADLVAQWAS